MDNLKSAVSRYFEILATLNFEAKNGILKEGVAPVIEQMKKNLENQITEAIKQANGGKEVKIYECDGGRYFKSRTPQLVRKDRLALQLAIYEYLTGEVFEMPRVKRRENTVDAFAQLFLARVKHQVEYGERQAGTLRHYLAKYNTYLKGTEFGKRDIRSITGRDLMEFYEEIAKDGNICRTNLRAIKSLINGTFDEAVLKYPSIIDPKRIDTSRIPCKKPHGRRVYQPEERAEIKRVCATKDDMYAKAIQVMCSIPVRIGEIEALKWDCVDWERGLLDIRRSMVEVECEDGIKRKQCVDHTKSKTAEKEDGRRKIPVNDELLEMLRELKRTSKSEYVFVNKAGNPLTSNKINEHIRKICKEAGVEYSPSHQLRFCAISMMYDRNIDETTIMQMAGHLNRSTTQHYDQSRKFLQKGVEDAVRAALN